MEVKSLATDIVPCVRRQDHPRFGGVVFDLLGQALLCPSLGGLSGNSRSALRPNDSSSTVIYRYRSAIKFAILNLSALRHVSPFGRRKQVPPSYIGFKTVARVRGKRSLRTWSGFESKEGDL